MVYVNPYKAAVLPHAALAVAVNCSIHIFSDKILFTADSEVTNTTAGALQTCWLLRWM
jgi:hypothetical protein